MTAVRFDVLRTFGDIPGGLFTTTALALGGLSSGAWVIRVLSASIDRVAFVSALKRCLDDDAPGRALELAESAPRAPLAAAIRAALIACRDRIAAPERGSSDYRTGGLDDSPDAVIARLRAAYDRGFDESMAPIARSRVFATVGAALACVALGSQWIVRDVAPAFAFAAPGLLVLLVLVARIDLRFRHDRVALFDALANALYKTARAPEGFARDPLPRPAARVPKPLTLVVREPGQPMRIEHVTTDRVEIGYFATAHVRLVSPGVAGVHAVIERSADEVTIRATATSAGTKVNGEPVTKRALRNGDLVSIGEADLRVEIGERADPA